MLMHDFMDLQNNHPSAAALIRAANLRQEHSSLYRMAYRTSWEEARYRELSKTPACKEEWYLKYLKEGE